MAYILRVCATNKGCNMTNEDIVNLIQKGVSEADNLEKLYIQNIRFLRYMANKYHSLAEFDDLMQEAYIGLYEAVKRYEDTTGVPFISFAAYWIKQSIHRYIENNGRNIRLTSQMISLVRHYRKIVSAYEMQQGHKPSDDEICRYLRIDNRKLEAVKKAHRIENIQSLDEVVPGTEDILLGESIPDQSVDVENDVIDGIMENSLHNELWEIVKENVTPEENKVIVSRFKGNLSLDATGQLIGKSREMVRQIEAKGLRKLRRGRITRLLAEKFEINYARTYRGGLSFFRNTWSSIVEDIAMKNMEASKPLNYNRF